jgi:hypothetical protein
VRLEDLDRALAARAPAPPLRVLPADSRKTEAVAIRDRLPPLFARCEPRELQSRVRDVRLRQASLAWSWGSGGLLFIGRTGAGKSSAAAWLFRRLLRVGWQQGGDAWARVGALRWFSAEDLVRARLEHALGRGEAPEIEQAERATLLFLDELGWERDPSVVSGVMQKRYERQLPTVTTSGRTAAELTAMYGAAVVRRMNDTGGPGSLTVVDCFSEAK